MTDDIVARLRAYSKYQGGWHKINETCDGAADEIERLRAERDGYAIYSDGQCAGKPLKTAIRSQQCARFGGYFC